MVRFTALYVLEPVIVIPILFSLWDGETETSFSSFKLWDGDSENDFVSITRYVP